MKGLAAHASTPEQGALCSITATRLSRLAFRRSRSHPAIRAQSRSTRSGSGTRWSPPSAQETWMGSIMPWYSGTMKLVGRSPA